jgi:hypothetical protein
LRTPAEITPKFLPNSNFWTLRRRAIARKVWALMLPIADDFFWGGVRVDFPIAAGWRAIYSPGANGETKQSLNIALTWQRRFLCGCRSKIWVNLYYRCWIFHLTPKSYPTALKTDNERQRKKN